MSNENPIYAEIPERNVYDNIADTVAIPRHTLKLEERAYENSGFCKGSQA
jgi:hypothetical protein